MGKESNWMERKGREIKCRKGNGKEKEIWEGRSGKEIKEEKRKEEAKEKDGEGEAEW